tara:strand:+ start:2895 stop:3797 length:903 start_codon:yes stop_codon:yes gene_type:complete
MADPKYYADDKAILDLMTQLLDRQEQAEVEGVLGAGTIALDAAGLKAAGTLGRLATKTDDIPYPKQSMIDERLQEDPFLLGLKNEYSPDIVGKYFDDDTMKKADYLLKEREQILSQDFIDDEALNKINMMFASDPKLRLAAQRRSVQSDNMTGLVDDIEDEIFAEGLAMDTQVLNQEKGFISSQDAYDDLQDNLLRDQRTEMLDDVADLRDLQKMNQQEYMKNALKQQQRGYGELAAATIPFLGGADMMQGAYSKYMDATKQMDQLYQQMTPEQKDKVDDMRRQRREEKYKLSDKDFRYR